MSDVTGNGQEPSPSIFAGAQAAPAPTATTPVEAPKTYDESTVKELREEAAKWRTQLREAQAALKDLQSAAGDNKTLAERLAGLEAQLAEKAAAAELAQKEAAVTRLAVEAGINPALVEMLDLSKIDLSDPKKAAQKLAELGGMAVKGNQARPGVVGNTGMSEADLKARYFGSGVKTTIFGG